MSDNVEQPVVTEPVVASKPQFNFIKFWTKGSGNLTSHSGGLSQGQVDFLKGLTVGDRLVMYKENDGSYTLKRFKRENEMRR